MDVQLYVYDLSQGLARQYSRALTGVQIDAIYHTSIVVNNVEYFYGHGIHRKVPGSTHHGRPMSVVDLGKTDLPLDVIEEYIESLEEIYTPESYDLFVHNCNNFSQDLAMFLVGQSIPDDIRTLPETFLRTPIGQMLRGQIDQSMRRMTQAPDAAAGQNVSRTSASRAAAQSTFNKLASNGTTTLAAPNGTTVHRLTPTAIINAKPPPQSPGHVYNISSLTELDSLLEAAKQSCAVIFFTSATCPPCKIVYPTYDELAAEAGAESGAKLIKVDISVSPSAHAVAQRYQVRATPTFITFLRGEKQDEWSGANPAQLMGNVRLLLQMARPPQHQHATLKLPTFQRIIETPIMYTRTPPLAKLLAKIGPEFSQDQSVQDLVAYIKTREDKGLAEAPLPNLHSFSAHLVAKSASVPQEARFAVIDLVRVAAADPRVSSFLATEHGEEHGTLNTVFSWTTGKTSDPSDFTDAPYNIQAVSLQLACNLFSSNVAQEQIFHRHNLNAGAGSSSGSLLSLREATEWLAVHSLLSPHANARSMAAALVYNLASYTHNRRIHAQTATVPTTGGSNEDEDAATPGDDLSAALLESITSLASVTSLTDTKTGNSSGKGNTTSTSKETLHALLLALGMLLYAAPPENMLWDLCRAMDIREVLKDIRTTGGGLGDEVKTEPLLREIGDELLGKGGF
ncbi:hypothetical protein ABEF92_000602 [Exophiala dermatitidis]|uniref:Mannosyl-glycoprotein endo-beta-N-acetylglucosaminidase n=1 Tax=Exophiala dermatitidis (strain ATCC 34100 / CBS 525.76 / NIH/UT8656) TaxID=858893 RepID=H6BP53_EXODN|nr:mannosyl-glycoprotein endo-beta-N-acetylglucosaminidase [Exophiala dermatitidis NIH/UT8656]EHY53280.1 mannosyl-glycoprotein endo-beta-N-acetylglucosaminidase [Exophiala dermatitidis NIH/UT8656]